MIKLSSYTMVIVNIDMPKPCDRVSYLYIRLLVLCIGFFLHIDNWIMAFITTISFEILINGKYSCFFRSTSGLCQVCPISPYFFLLVVEGLIHSLADANKKGVEKGIKIGRQENLTH